MKVSSTTLSRLVMVGTAISAIANAEAQLSETMLHSFGGGNDGQQPYAGLVQGSDGALYGTTYLGGSNNAGVVFKIKPDGTGNTPLYHFGASKNDPFGLSYPSGLIQGFDGGLYGTTGFGGTAGNGSVFRINTDGSGYAVLQSFSPSAGHEPTAALVQGRDGTLFGTTQGGGAGVGTVFKLGTNGEDFVQIYVFGLVPGDPATPQAPLIQGLDGALYGTTSAGGASAVGGASGYGTVIRMNTDGTEEIVLHSFIPGGNDGQRPYGGLIQGNDGSLYGTTQEGGSLGFGIVFKLKPDGTDYTILHSFDPEGGDGKYPNSGLALGNDGALYGTTEFGGSNNLGAVFRLNPDGSEYRSLYSFGSSAGDGSYPKAPLLRAADGGLFGTAQFGGGDNFGTIFRLAPAPTVISMVKSLGDQTVHLSLTGAPHFEYRIEGTSDHVHWTVVTNLYNATGTAQFVDSEAAKFPVRFYRAAWVP